MDNKEVLNSITSIKRPTASRVEILTYDDNGRIQTKTDDLLASAMSIQSGKGITYKVKVDKEKHFYNPIKGDKIDSKDVHTKDLRFKFLSVSERCFNEYIRYLRSGYDSHLVIAEREI